MSLTCPGHVLCSLSSQNTSTITKTTHKAKGEEVLGKKAKNAEVGKLTEADKANTGRVSCLEPVYVCELQ